MKAKICGITNKKDAAAAVYAGADAIGCIVDVPVETPRKITLEEAVNIRKALKDVNHTFIAVLMPETLEDVTRVVGKLKPEGIQLHGREDVNLLSQIREEVDCHIIKAFHVVEGKADMDYVREASEYADLVLADTRVKDKAGGTGKTHDRSIDRQIAEETGKPLILSGGLTHENVKDAVKAASPVRPYAVDASSGVEKEPGIKDHDKVGKFVGVSSCI